MIESYTYINDITKQYPDILVKIDNIYLTAENTIYGNNQLQSGDVNYQYDGLGNITTYTANNDTETVTYDPFGNTESDVSNEFGYNSEYNVTEGLQYLRARYYNPETARFITQDTVYGNVEEPLSQNRYTYTQNNPICYDDPSGNLVIPGSWAAALTVAHKTLKWVNRARMANNTKKSISNAVEQDDYTIILKDLVTGVVSHGASRLLAGEIRKNIDKAPIRFDFRNSRKVEKDSENYENDVYEDVLVWVERSTDHIKGTYDFISQALASGALFLVDMYYNVVVNAVGNESQIIFEVEIVVDGTEIDKYNSDTHVNTPTKEANLGEEKYDSGVSNGGSYSYNYSPPPKVYCDEVYYVPYIYYGYSGTNGM